MMIDGDEMKVCFIGACGHYGNALSYLKSRKDVVLCGFAPGCSEECKIDSIDEKIPFFSNYKTMLNTVKPNLAIVSPIFGKTGEIIIECAKLEINVFAEKPVATTFEELDRVKNAVKESGIHFCAMHYLRFDPAFFHAAKMVRDGKIGKLQMITAQKSYKFGRRPDWYRVPELYGGTIPWVGIHAMDWIAYFSGKKFISVTAQSIGKSPEMAALCQFKLEEDIIASVNIDYYRPQSAATHGDDRIRCVGTKGVLEVRESKILLISKDGIFEYCPNTAPELLEEFLNGNIPLTNDEIFHITEAAIAARESANTQKTIMIGE